MYNDPFVELKLPQISPIDIHYVLVRMSTIPGRLKEDLGAIRRPEAAIINLRMLRQVDLVTAIPIHHVDFGIHRIISVGIKLDSSAIRGPLRG